MQQKKKVKTCFEPVMQQEIVKHPRLNVDAKNSWLLKSVNYFRKKGSLHSTYLTGSSQGTLS